MSIQTVLVPLIAFLVSFAARFIPAAKPRLWLWLIASYFMYQRLAGTGFLTLLIASSVMNYFWGALLRRRPTTGILWTAIGSNILLLAYFKYLPSLVSVWPAPFSELDFVQRIVLPLGVSFWTFQALSYLLDTYLEEELNPSIVEFCLYMAFWPTVALGPVCRLTKMLPQFRKLSGTIREDFSIGVTRLIQGLFMKLVLSQLLVAGIISGGGVASGFDTTGVQRSALDVWALAIGYGFQLFFDFAGYSNIVVGAARLVGIRLEENFNRPYLATTPAIFWTRWHMSLSSWIRQYLYMPLSTLGRSQWWRYAVLVIPMVIFGFWHDARMTLVLWGLYNGLLLVGHRMGQQLARRIPYKLPRPLGALLSWAATFLLVCLSYVFFRANSLGQALHMMRTVLVPSSYGLAHTTLQLDYYLMVAFVAVGYFGFVGLSQLHILWTEYCQQRSENRKDPLQAKPVSAWSTLTWTVLWVSQVVAVRKWWMLVPVLALLLMIVCLSFLDNSDMAPFVYQHF